MNAAPENNAASEKKFGTYLPWIIAAVAVLALAVNLLWDRGAPEQADEATIAQLNERLEALETGAPRNAGRRNPGMGTPGATADGGRGGMLDAMREQRTPEQIEADREKELLELEAQFARDAADPAGAAKVENTLVETISGETMAGTGLKPNDVDIACKQNTCRIVGTFDRMGDAQDWSLFYITAAGGNVLSQTRMVFVPKPGGRTEVRIYSARAKG